MERSFPKITEEGLDALRQRIGKKIGQTAEPWCHEATRDNIRHYAHGIGDDNPLWCVPEYAKKTKFGDVIALPSFLFATSRIISGYVGGLPGIHAMWSGSDWHWHKTVDRNDEITTEAWLKDLIVHETKFAGRAVQQIYHVDFFNQNGDLVPAPTAGASARSVTTPARRARSTRSCVASRCVATPTRSWPTPTGSTPKRRSAAPSPASGRTSRKARRCPPCSRGR
jgi:acyl dehydratase